ncbi:MAG: type II secretion system F family protein [Pseudomonas sp.]|nr:type II secretion system F family protein [Pseudomonas sp.]
MANKKIPKTSVYKWEGKNRQGALLSGQMTGQDAVMIKALLRKQGITPSKVQKKGIDLFRAGKKIKPMDIAIFTRQMATMMKAGVPLLQSFDIIAEGVDNPTLRKLVDTVKNDVASGNSFAVSLRRHPQYFDELYCNLVESGEQSGALESLLDRVATYKEKTEALKAKIKKAMNYPIAVVAVAVVVTAILLIKVVPQFQEVFASFGAELPAFTLFVIAISEYIQSNGWMILLGLVAAVFVFRRLYRNSKKFRDTMDRVLLKAPVFGNIIYNSSVARFARTLATTFAAGVPLVEALDSVAGATGNVVFREAVNKVNADISGGMQLNFAMRSTGVFPSMVLQMTSIGEESGALDEMLDKVATHYEAEVDNAVDGLTALMEPLIMSVLGVLVGGLIVAMYLPIFQLGAVV